MFNTKLNLQQGFTPRHLGCPKMRYSLKNYCIIIVLARGGTVGQALFLTSSYPCFVFYIPAMADDPSQHLCTGYCCNNQNDDRLVHKINNEGMPS
jgi:hypothetical protein